MKERKGIPTWRKTMYGAGEIANTLVFTVVPLFLMFYLTDVLGVPAGWAAIVSFAGNIWDAVTDPYAGFRSDCSQSKFGRRRVYFLSMALPMAITFALMFSVPTGLPMGWKIALVSLAYMAMLVTSTFFIVPYLAYGMEIDPSYDGRTSVSAWRMFFSIAFGLVGATVPSMIWGASAVPSEGFRNMAWLVAIPVAIAPLFAFFSGKEPKAKTPVPKSMHFFKDLRLAVKNRDFLKGLCIYVFSWMGIAVLQLMLIYYVKYVLEMYDQYALIAGIIFGLAILCLPLWVWVSNRLDKRKAYLIGAGLFSIILLLLALPKAFVKSIVWVLVPLLGVGLSAVHVMPSAIVPEAIDLAVQQENSIGAGSYTGVMTFLTKIGNAAVSALIMGILGATGYISTEEAVFVAQPAAAISAIQYLLVGFAVVMFLGGILVCFRFQIGRTKE